MAAQARKCIHCSERIPRDSEWELLGSRLIANSSAFLLAASLVMYGVARVSVDSFYDKLHVSAEEVGLSETTILTRVAVYSVLSLLALIFVLLADATLVPIVRGLRKRKDPTTAPPGPRLAEETLRWLAAVLAGIALVLLPSLMIVDLRRSLLTFLISALLVSLLLLASHQRHARKLFVRPAVGFVVALALPAVISLGYAVAKERGGDLANAAKNGETVEPHGWELLPVSAEPVCVRWIGPARAASPNPADVYLYLGGTNGMSILYDQRTGQPLRVPAAAVVLVGARDSTRCGS